jgi:ketosteroid isomerase-like protein
VSIDAALVNRIKRSYELFNETGRFDEEFFHPDIEWRNAPEVPGASLHRGRDAVVAEIAAQGEAWEHRKAEPREVVLSGDKAVVSVHGTSRGRSSGASVEVDVVHVWTLEEGKVRRIEAFLDRAAALRAAGLE